MKNRLTKRVYVVPAADKLIPESNVEVNGLVSSNGSSSFHERVVDLFKVSGKKPPILELPPQELIRLGVISLPEVPGVSLRA